MSPPMASSGSTGRDRCLEAIFWDESNSYHLRPQVLSVSMDEENVVPYIQGTLNNNDLALRMAVRWHNDSLFSNYNYWWNLSFTCVSQEQPVRSWPIVCHKIQRVVWTRSIQRGCQGEPILFLSSLLLFWIVIGSLIMKWEEQANRSCMQVAANAPKGILRTPLTISKFQQVRSWSKLASNEPWSDDKSVSTE